MGIFGPHAFDDHELVEAHDPRETAKDVGHSPASEAREEEVFAKHRPLTSLDDVAAWAPAAPTAPANVRSTSEKSIRHASIVK
jgi:hypothetical protein